MADLGRRLVEVPVGFKWFVDGLVDGSIGFGGEESAGASFLRRDGTVWTTDKDGLIACLLAAELTAKTGRNPSEAYAGLTARFGAPAYRRIDAPATPALKAALGRLSPSAVTASTLGGDPITAILTNAPGNGAAIGGLKVVTAEGWFAARPSGTENVTKLYAESFRERTISAGSWTRRARSSPRRSRSRARRAPARCSPARNSRRCDRTGRGPPLTHDPRRCTHAAAPLPLHPLMRVGINRGVIVQGTATQPGFRGCSRSLPADLMHWGITGRNRGAGGPSPSGRATGSSPAEAGTECAGTNEYPIRGWSP